MFVDLDIRSVPFSSTVAPEISFFHSFVFPLFRFCISFYRYFLFRGFQFFSRFLKLLIYIIPGRLVPQIIGSCTINKSKNSRQL